MAGTAANGAGGSPADAMKTVPPAVERDHEPAWPAAAVLIGVAFLVYGPALRGGWLWDDNVDLTDNLLLRDWRGLGKIWFAPTTLDYYPLKFTVQWLQWQLWGDNVTGYHLTNVVLHGCGGILLWRVFARLGLRFAWCGALLFIVHPLAVESVAWIAELKNTLSLPPLLLALLAWFDYGESGDQRPYWRSVAWFLVAMLCKSSVVMFPVALLLFAWWRRGRIAFSDVRVLAPFFAIALVLGLVTLWFQSTRALDSESLALGGWLSRLGLAGTALAFYAWKAVWPAGLLPIYPQWQITPPSLWLLTPWAMLAGLTAWSWRRRRSWGRHALLGGGWFLLHLLPFVGFVPISFMRFTWVMDHFTYVALPGLIGLTLAGVQALPRPRVALAGLIATAALLGGIARADAARYRDARVFWQHAVTHHHQSAIAHNNLGRALADHDEWGRACGAFEEALRLDPVSFEARLNLGNTLRKLGRADESLRHLQAAVGQKPDVAAAHHTLGLTLDALGRTEEAKASYQRALRLDPNYVVAMDSHGQSLARAGRHAEAQDVFAAALRSNPNLPDVHHHLAMSLNAVGKTAEALSHFEAAARLAPDSAEAHNNLAAALVASGRSADAVASFARAVALRGEFVDARLNLGLVLMQLHRIQEAVPHFEAVLRAQPTSLRGHYHLAVALVASGRLNDAIPHFERALQIDPNHAEIHETFAEALSAAGRNDEASAHHAEARRLNPARPAR